MGVYSNFETDVLHSVMAAVSSAQPAVCPGHTKPDNIEWNKSGFTGRVRVGTAFGDLPIEALRLRDEIRTSSGRLAPRSMDRQIAAG